MINDLDEDLNSCTINIKIHYSSDFEAGWGLLVIPLQLCLFLNQMTGKPAKFFFKKAA